MTLSDIEQVYAIECSCFTQPWSQESLIGEIVRNDIAHYVVADLDGRIIGYAGIWVMFDEAHMTNIAVIPEFRRQGVARNIILCMMRYASDKGASRMTLEVREFNFKAQNLYTSLDFKKVGIRRKYYSDTGENAFILWNDDINATLTSHQNGYGHADN
ncbi:MAG: ribosomal protein S18-alanine N-acetyltransferase [Clostridia bacterium]|nr:ribosomal protein S18-alanine N-acetyltransferase [Clostridia bacterium]MBR6006356.1 ribosomal protein S18-alanine N-acetyltransferase [Clostridia bacterium]